MAYTLTIEFTGLFSFVPHAARNCLYVLLPTSQDTAHHHMPELRYRKLTSTPEHFAREHLRLSGIDDCTGTTIQVPPAACDLHEITGERLPLRQVEDVPTDRVRLRIELPPATHIEAGKRTNWRLNGERDLTHQITWVREGLTLPAIKFLRSPLDGGSETSLSFVPQGSELKLFFRHLPHHGMCIEMGQPAEHFSLYYSLYSPPRDGNDPILAQQPPFPCPQSLRRLRRKSRQFHDAVSTFTCMTSQG